MKSGKDGKAERAEKRKSGKAGKRETGNGGKMGMWKVGEVSTWENEKSGNGNRGAVGDVGRRVES